MGFLETATKQYSMNSRRNFLRQLAITAGTPALLCSRVFCEEQPALIPLTETDPMAVAFKYKEDATQVDAATNPQYKAGQICENCALYQGEPGDKLGPCAIFPGKSVTAAGWCMTYAPKPPAAPAEAPAEEAPAAKPE